MTQKDQIGRVVSVGNLKDYYQFTEVFVIKPEIVLNKRLPAKIEISSCLKQRITKESRDYLSIRMAEPEKAVELHRIITKAIKKLAKHQGPGKYAHVMHELRKNVA